MKTESKKEGSEETKRFLDKNWGAMLAVAGAAGVVGAGLWLTARYLREKKKRTKELDQALQMVEEDVMSAKSDTVMLLETGMYLSEVAGDEGKKALLELAESVDDEEAKEILHLIRESMEVNKRKSGKR